MSADFTRPRLQIQSLYVFQHVVGRLLQLAEFVGGQFHFDDFLDAVRADDATGLHGDFRIASKPLAN